jgi:hypothetical protein
MSVKSDAATLLLFFFFLGLLLAPLATIWALNVLFPALAIPYSIETWFAIILLIGVGKTTITARKE